MTLQIPTSDGQPRPNEPDSVENVAAAELRQFIERIERLTEEKAIISGDIKDVYGEAKGRGYDTKAIREIVRIRRKDAAERAEEQSILSTYLIALGMAPEDVL
jgi:uncharacterized protein (UPF0335 family)